MDNKQALKGLKVLELTQSLAGAYCSKLLSDMGAETIKIEKPGFGDESRNREPFKDDIPHPERSGLFLYLNINKLGITLNIDSDAGIEILKKLVMETDILITDYPLQTMDMKGISYKNLKEINKKLVMTSITPFGHTGPYKNYNAYPLNTFHASGIGYLTPFGSRFPDRPPLKWGGNSGEFTCGLVSAIATLGAVYSQKSSGKGQLIDVSKQEALLSLVKVFIAYYPLDKRIANRFTGMLKGDDANRSFSSTPCKDGYALLVPAFERQLESLEKLLGTKSETVEERQQLIAEWVATGTKEEIYKQGQAVRIPSAAIRDISEVVNSEQYEARGFFIETDHPELGNIKMPTAPYVFSETPWSLERTAPMLGEHNEDIYCQRLGYSKQDITRLRQAGII